LLSFLGDAAVVAIALMLAYVLRFETAMRGWGVEDPAVEVGNYLGHIFTGGLLMLFLLGNYRLHDPRNFLSLLRNLRAILKAGFIWFAAFLGFSLALKLEPQVSRLYCAVAAASLVVFLSGWRWLLQGILNREPIAGSLRQKVLFFGWNSECSRAFQRLRASSEQRIEVVGVVAPEGGRFAEKPPLGIRRLGTSDSLRRVMRDSGADVLMVVDGAVAREEMLEIAETCGKEFVDFKLVPSCFQVLVSGLRLESIHGMPILGIGRLPLHHAFNNAVKRALDIAGAAIGLLLAAPVIGVFCAIVYYESPGPVIYRQRRVGLNGRPFDIFKIRSMKPDAESTGAPGWTVRDDPRRLRIGSFMRAWNIDELPQFWNVLKGDMSLVGPRPERPELIEDFKEEIPHYNVRHHIKPGITGWAQVNGLRGDTCLRERVKFDLDYIENWNLVFDFRIMIMTLLSRKGAC
jgi:exopolysaccharide biosynthesis polyprenyl glycosylphosphotransferase